MILIDLKVKAHNVIVYGTKKVIKVKSGRPVDSMGEKSTKYLVKELMLKRMPRIRDEVKEIDYYKLLKSLNRISV